KSKPGYAMLVDKMDFLALRHRQRLFCISPSFLRESSRQYNRLTRVALSHGRCFPKEKDIFPVFARFIAFAATFFLALPALAQGEPQAPKAIGAPANWALGMQEAFSPVKHRMHDFHDYLLVPVITVIVLFVFALLLFIILRYNAKANPTPAT